jgi:hypothetical protein
MYIKYFILKICDYDDEENILIYLNNKIFKKITADMVDFIFEFMCKSSVNSAKIEFIINSKKFTIAYYNDEIDLESRKILISNSEDLCMLSYNSIINLNNGLFWLMILNKKPICYLEQSVDFLKLSVGGKYKSFDCVISTVEIFQKYIDLAHGNIINIKSIFDKNIDELLVCNLSVVDISTMKLTNYKMTGEDKKAIVAISIKKEIINIKKKDITNSFFYAHLEKYYEMTIKTKKIIDVHNHNNKFICCLFEYFDYDVNFKKVILENIIKLNEVTGGYYYSKYLKYKTKYLNLKSAH